MKNVGKVLLPVIALLFLLALGAGAASRTVTIYLLDPSINSPANPFSLKGVPRVVNAAAPARNALVKLLAGPTAAEKAAGLLRLEDGTLHVGTYTVHHKAAKVNFVGHESWPGDLSPDRFRAAVTKTLRQFPGIQKVTVSVNGRADFGSLK
ncbi:MAG: GerMN domain-containing protein [Armatimonadetes bacterium]|nr:GerMN domain-containing protein [Armatimonadota bacterium]